MHRLIYFIRKTSVAVAFIILEFIAIYWYAYSTPYTQARLLSLSNRVVGDINSAFSGVTNYFSLREENGRLTSHIASLENRICELEMAMPEEAIVVDSLVQQYTYISARVVSASTNRSRNFMTINKGTSDGVTADMAVMTPEGYAVGVVVDCSDNFAVAMMLLNKDMRLGGVLAEDGSHGSISWRGDDTQVVDFVEVSKYANMKEGDAVQAYSKYFPTTAVIGHIESVKLAESGTSFNCKVRLAADMDRLFNVVLVRNNSVGEIKELENRAKKND